MTKEKKFVFDVEDISRLRVRCNNCAGVIIYDFKSNSKPTDPVRGQNGLPTACPRCRRGWSSHNKWPEGLLVDDLEAIRGGCDRPLTISFEMDL